jgi:hypothetical protein
MTTNDSELRDEALWPSDRLERAQVEIAEEQARRAAAEAASRAASLTAEQKEAASMRELGGMRGIDARKKILSEHGFDPGWNS